MRLAPHFSTWVIKYYTIELLKSGDFDKSKAFIKEQLDKKLDWETAKPLFYVFLAYINAKEGNLKKAKEFLKRLDGIGYTAETFMIESIGWKEKGFYKDVVNTLTPIGLVKK